MTVADDLATLRSALQRRDEHERRGAWQSPTPEQLALERVEAEIARLHALIEGSATDEAILQAAEAEAESWKTTAHNCGARVRELEDEAARLRDGLRPEPLARLFHETYESLAPFHGYKTRKDSAVSWDEVPAANKALMIATADTVARALLAEDGAACGNQDRIVGREVVCELSAGHDGPHQMGGARWRRAEDGAA